MSNQPFDVLALLRDPHYDQRPAADFDRATELVAELIEAAQVAVTDPKGLNRLGVAVARVRGVV
jgi:hypothetical protein